MADENKGVVTGTQGLNPTQLFSATREVFRASTAAPRAPANTGVACPRCKENGVIGNPVISTDQGLRCNLGHQYKDTMELLGQPHDTVPVAQHRVIQENWVPYQIQIPSNVLQALQAKYNDPEKIKAAFAALAQRLTEDNTIIIPELEVKRLSDACGAPIRSAAELFGVIKGQQQQISDLQDEVKVGGPAPSTGGGALRRGELILWFDPPTTSSLIEKAKSAGRRLEEFLESWIGHANENNWF